MPEEWKEKDELSLHILQSFFPDREVIMNDAFAVNFEGGGVNCISMHQPELSQN
jgi:agmatine/peptidylarginine deiminase